MANWTAAIRQATPKKAADAGPKPSFPFEDLQIISPTRRTIELEELKAKR